MDFIKSLFYLIVFPGCILCLLGGFFVYLVSGRVVHLFAKGSNLPNAQMSNQITLKTLIEEAIGFLGKGPLYWVVLSVCIGALSWAMCMMVGALGGDVFLLYSMIILYLGSVLLSRMSFRFSAKMSPTEIIGIFPPCVLISVLGIILLAYLTTGEFSLSGIRLWQNMNGPVLLSGEGGAFHVAARVLVSFAFLISISRFISVHQSNNREEETQRESVLRCGFKTGTDHAVFLLLGFSFAFVMEFLFLSIFLGLPVRAELDTVFRFISIFPLTFVLASVSAYIQARGEKFDFVTVGTALSAAIIGVILIAFF